MPELPDLQVFSSNLNKKLSGKIVKKIYVPEPKKLNVSETELKKGIEGQAVKDIYRVGKELHFKFENGNVLGLHLMLNGKLYLFEENNQQKNTIIELLFDDNTGLAMVDYQIQATPTLNPQPRDAVDALSNQLDFTYLKEQMSKRKASIKNLLLDQHVIRGIGNAYADEILWDAGISPFSICNKVPDAEIKKLASSIRNVLHNAEEQFLKLILIL